MASKSLKSYYKHHEKYTGLNCHRGKIFYRKHRERLQKEARERYWKKKNANPEAFKAYQHEVYRRNAERILDASRSRSKYLRNQVLEAYGAICKCCGETEKNFLSVDHIFNDGHAERKLHKNVSTNFYEFLRDSGYPKDRYQLLCMNCNWGRRMNGGTCPHVEAIVDTFIKREPIHAQ